MTQFIYMKFYIFTCIKRSPFLWLLVNRAFLRELKVKCLALHWTDWLFDCLDIWNVFSRVEMKYLTSSLRSLWKSLSVLEDWTVIPERRKEWIAPRKYRHSSGIKRTYLRGILKVSFSYLWRVLPFLVLPQTKKQLLCLLKRLFVLWHSLIRSYHSFLFIFVPYYLSRAFYPHIFSLFTRSYFTSVYIFSYPWWCHRSAKA